MTPTFVDWVQRLTRSDRKPHNNSTLACRFGLRRRLTVPMDKLPSKEDTVAGGKDPDDGPGQQDGAQQLEVDDIHETEDVLLAMWVCSTQDVVKGDFGYSNIDCALGSTKAREIVPIPRGEPYMGYTGNGWGQTNVFAQAYWDEDTFCDEEWAWSNNSGYALGWAHYGSFNSLQFGWLTDKFCRIRSWKLLLAPTEVGCGPQQKTLRALLPPGVYLQ